MGRSFLNGQLIIHLQIKCATSVTSLAVSLITGSLYDTSADCIKGAFLFCVTTELNHVPN